MPSNNQKNIAPAIINPYFNESRFVNDNQINILKKLHIIKLAYRNDGTASSNVSLTRAYSACILCKVSKNCCDIAILQMTPKNSVQWWRVLSSLAIAHWQKQFIQSDQDNWTINRWGCVAVYNFIVQYFSRTRDLWAYPFSLFILVRILYSLFVNIWWVFFRNSIPWTWFPKTLRSPNIPYAEAISSRCVTTRKFGSSSSLLDEDNFFVNWEYNNRFKELNCLWCCVQPIIIGCTSQHQHWQNDWNRNATNIIRIWHTSTKALFNPIC